MKTIKDIRDNNIKEWKENCDKEVKCQIILNKLKKDKKIKRHQAKNVQAVIENLGQENFKFVKTVLGEQNGG